jgi:hypothetical protein
LRKIDEFQQFAGHDTPSRLAASRDAPQFKFSDWPDYNNVFTGERVKNPIKVINTDLLGVSEPSSRIPVELCQSVSIILVSKWD